MAGEHGTLKPSNQVNWGNTVRMGSWCENTSGLWGDARLKSCGVRAACRTICVWGMRRVGQRKCRPVAGQSRTAFPRTSSPFPRICRVQLAVGSRRSSVIDVLAINTIKCRSSKPQSWSWCEHFLNLRLFPFHFGGPIAKTLGTIRPNL